MSKFFTFVTAMLVSSASAGLVGKVVIGLQTDLGSVKQVVDQTVTAIGSSQCGNAKYIFGVRKENYNGSEPNLEDLTIDFITKDVKFEYKLTVAAKLIPQNPWYNASLPLIIYMHGFTDNPEKQSFSDISQAFISQGNFNIVALDASSMIGSLYIRATTYVEFIGYELGKMMTSLYSDGLDPDNMHLVGHSLGSHISGFAGKIFYEKTGKHIGRISGLDPAGPCFSDLKDDMRLSKDHAKFVFIVHTDMGVYGLNEQIGHADFYPNGGYQQPNCVLQTCSHSRAWELFAESVRNLTAFIGVSCEDYKSFREENCDFNNTSIMGFQTYPSAEGKYFLKTNKESPYGLGKEGVVYSDDRGALTRIFNTVGILQK